MGCPRSRGPGGLPGGGSSGRQSAEQLGLQRTTDPRGRCSRERHHAAAGGPCAPRPLPPSVRGVASSSLPPPGLGLGFLICFRDDSPPGLVQGRRGHPRRPQRPALAAITICALTLGRGGQSETRQPGGPVRAWGPGVAHQACSRVDLAFRQGGPSGQPCLRARVFSRQENPWRLPLAPKAAPCLTGGVRRAVWGPQTWLPPTTAPALWLLGPHCLAQFHRPQPGRRPAQVWPEGLLGP